MGLHCPKLSGAEGNCDSIMEPIECASFDATLVTCELVRSRASNTMKRLPRSTALVRVAGLRSPLAEAARRWRQRHAPRTTRTCEGQVQRQCDRRARTEWADRADSPLVRGRQGDRLQARAVFVQQTELFKPRGLSLEAVEAKLCAAPKAKASTGLRAADARRANARSAPPSQALILNASRLPVVGFASWVLRPLMLPPSPACRARGTTARASWAAA
jgi:hypothetical protein